MKRIKKQTKGFIAGVVVTFLISTPAFAAGGYILSHFQTKIVFNGTQRQASDKPYKYFNGKTYVPEALNYKGTTYVPLRFFS